RPRQEGEEPIGGRFGPGRAQQGHCQLKGEYEPRERGHTQQQPVAPEPACRARVGGTPRRTTYRRVGWGGVVCIHGVRRKRGPEAPPAPRIERGTWGRGRSPAPKDTIGRRSYTHMNATCSFLTRLVRHGMVAPPDAPSS